jgi:pimeloyl-ACP methyl ester carboxylesterase
MASFVLIPGAGGAAWYWHRVVPLLADAGHDALAVDLPGDDETAGLPEYVATAREAMTRFDGRVIVVGQSLGGFTAASVSADPNVAALIFVNAMIPMPGETAGAWSENTASAPARVEAAMVGGYSTEFDIETYFLHDVAAEVVTAGESEQRGESNAIFGSVCDFAWPSVPIDVIAGSDDRLFPVDFQRRVARERLDADVVAIPGGHLVALSNPAGLAEQLLLAGRRLSGS